MEEYEQVHTIPFTCLFPLCREGETNSGEQQEHVRVGKEGVLFQCLSHICITSLSAKGWAGNVGSNLVICTATADQR